MSRVKNIFREGNELVIVYSDCEEERIDLCTDCDPPPSEDPGDYPDPVPAPTTRCRVALKLAARIVTDRYIDFLSAATPTVTADAILLGGVVAAKIALWVWPITAFPYLEGFAINAVSSGARSAALDAYAADSAGFLNDVANFIYCCLSDPVVIDAISVGCFRGAMASSGLQQYEALAVFLSFYPLNILRQEAFDASVTTDAIDCSGLDCDEASSWCYEWNFTTSNGGWTNFELANGGTMGWVMGSGWHQINPTGGRDGVAIRKSLGGIAHFQRIEIEFAVEFNGANPKIAFGNYTDVFINEQNIPPFGNPAYFVGDFNRDGLSIYVDKAIGSTVQYFNDNYIKKIRISGGGTLPAFLSGGAACP